MKWIVKSGSSLSLTLRLTLTLALALAGSAHWTANPNLTLGLGLGLVLETRLHLSLAPTSMSLTPKYPTGCCGYMPKETARPLVVRVRARGKARPLNVVLIRVVHFWFSRGLHAECSGWSGQAILDPTDTMSIVCCQRFATPFQTLHRHHRHHHHHRRHLLQIISRRTAIVRTLWKAVMVAQLGDQPRIQFCCPYLISIAVSYAHRALWCTPASAPPF